MAALNYDGKVVAIGDSVTIMGSVDTVSGTGSLATVTVLPLQSASDITIKANDAESVQHPSDSSHTAVSRSGKYYGPGDRISIPGTVTSVTGSGQAALIGVTLGTSGSSVTVPAGACRSPFTH